MAHLARCGVSVAAPIESPAGKLVESIDDGAGGSFLATAFQRAPGGPPNRASWTSENTREYGRTLARLHQASQSYTPNLLRPDWKDDSDTLVDKFVPKSQMAVIRRYAELVERLECLPTDPQSYGLIHQDAHFGNFFIDADGRITLFDFDDCVTSWFANDLAIALFYQVANQADSSDRAMRFLPDFLGGYREVRALSVDWLGAFPDFLKLREIELYAIMYRDFDVAAIPHPWCAAFMEGRRERIEAEIPVLDLDMRSDF